MMIVSIYVPYPVETEVFLGACPELGTESGLVFLGTNLNSPKLLTFQNFGPSWTQWSKVACSSD